MLGWKELYRVWMRRLAWLGDSADTGMAIPDFEGKKVGHVGLYILIICLTPTLIAFPAYMSKSAWKAEAVARNLGRYGLVILVSYRQYSCDLLTHRGFHLDAVGCGE